MLVLVRKVGERIVIDESIEVTVIKLHGNRVRLGVTAPSDVSVCRTEVLKTTVDAASSSEAAPHKALSPSRTAAAE
jgi:carbon storage regulator